MRNDSSKWPNDPCTTCFPETREIHNFSNVSLTERQSQVLGLGGLNLGPLSSLRLKLSLFCRSKTFVAEFALKASSPIIHTSILDCTSLQAGIHRGKTPNSKTSSFFCAKRYEGTFLKANHAGRTTSQDRRGQNSRN